MSARKDIWYNYNNLLSKNCLFNFVVGIRGGGKTYGAKKRAIKQYLKTGEQFIYLRRYKTELKSIHTQFFSDIKHEFPECEFSVKGKNIYCNGKLMGYAIALSTSGIEKSNSFPDIKTIIYDEFLITSKGNQRYLANEVTAFLEFYETVARLRDDVRVIFIGNSITSVNPYFIHFNVKYNDDKQFYKFKNLICVEFYKNEDFKQEKLKTRFGQLNAHTEYGAYMMDNAFLEDSDHFISEKTSDAKCLCNFAFKGKEFGFWVDESQSKCFLSKKPNETRMTYAITINDHQPNTLLIKGTGIDNPHGLRLFRTSYANGCLFFDSQETKKVGEEMYKMVY